MPEFGPLAPFIGAVTGAAITALVAYFILQKRKRVSFYIGPSEDLTQALRKHNRSVVLKIGDKETSNLHRSSVWVRNSGNTAVTTVTFDVIVLGTHPFHEIEIASEDVRLNNDVAIEWQDKEGGAYDPYARVTVPFLNSRESFQVLVFYDGKAQEINVSSRMEDVSVRVRRGARDSKPLGALELLKELFLRKDNVVVAVGTLAVIAFFIGASANFAEVVARRIVEQFGPYTTEPLNGAPRGK